MSVIEAAALAPAAAALYMLPAIIACARKSPRTGTIVAVNACLGWTVIGWVRALQMALSAPAGRPCRGTALPPAAAGCPAPGRTPPRLRR